MESENRVFENENFKVIDASFYYAKKRVPPPEFQYKPGEDYVSFEKLYSEYLHKYHYCFPSGSREYLAYERLKNK
jgi:hypothetical protein